VHTAVITNKILRLVLPQSCLRATMTETGC